MLGLRGSWRHNCIPLPRSHQDQNVTLWCKTGSKSLCLHSPFLLGIFFVFVGFLLSWPIGSVNIYLYTHIFTGTREREREREKERERERFIYVYTYIYVYTIHMLTYIHTNMHTAVIPIQCPGGGVLDGRSPVFPAGFFVARAANP